MLTTIRRRSLRAAPLVGALLLAAAVPRASALDHLTCAKVRDSLPRGKFRAVLGSAGGGVPCVVKVPAKTVCVTTEDTSVTPPPPEAMQGSVSGAFLCYRAKCARPVPHDVDVTDPFGHRVVSQRIPQMVCFSTTGSTLVTSTTTPGATTTTTTLAATGQCTFSDGTCKGTCPGGGQCGAVVGTADCACQQVSCGNADAPQCAGFCQEAGEACIFSVDGCSCVRIP
jgi:hypothetical protein